MDSELPQRLIKARSGHGWSQADLAQVSGVAAAQISRYEQGRSKPRSEVVAKLAKALAVSFEWLAFGRGQAEANLEVPAYPADQHLLDPVELDVETYDAVAEIAKAEGWTMEMALKQLFLEGLRLRAKKRQDEGAS